MKRSTLYVVLYLLAIATSCISVLNLYHVVGFENILLSVSVLGRLSIVFMVLTIFFVDLIRGKNRKE